MCPPDHQLICQLISLPLATRRHVSQCIHCSTARQVFYQCIGLSTRSQACSSVRQIARPLVNLRTLLTYTRELARRALGNLSICAPLSGQSPAWARWERALLSGTRTYGRRSPIYIRTIIMRYLNNSWPLLVVSRRLFVILMPHQKVTQKDVADNHFWGRPIMPGMPQNWWGSSMDT